MEASDLTAVVTSRKLNCTVRTCRPSVAAQMKVSRSYCVVVVAPSPDLGTVGSCSQKSEILDGGQRRLWAVLSSEPLGYLTCSRLRP